MSDTPTKPESAEGAAMEMMNVIKIRRRLFDRPSHPAEGESDLRLGIFIDRAESRCAAMILNTANNSYAFLTAGEHHIEDPDDWDSVCEAVNQACLDIQRWSETEHEL